MNFSESKKQKIIDTVSDDIILTVSSWAEIPTINELSCICSDYLTAFLKNNFPDYNDKRDYLTNCILYNEIYDIAIDFFYN